MLREELEQGSEWSAWTASRPGSLLHKQVPWTGLCEGRAHATENCGPWSTCTTHFFDIGRSRPPSPRLRYRIPALLLCCCCCCCSLHVGAPCRSGKAGRDNPQGGAHGCATFL
ncbi:hypothetical protein xavtCFBP7764_14665 [Xanthomonas citri]|nr:hypothetical protein xavtCFBP7764_14665 [Xanthomonas citri]